MINFFKNIVYLTSELQNVLQQIIGCMKDSVNVLKLPNRV